VYLSRWGSRRFPFGLNTLTPSWEIWESKEVVRLTRRCSTTNNGLLLFGVRFSLVIAGVRRPLDALAFPLSWVIFGSQTSLHAKLASCDRRAAATAGEMDYYHHDSGKASGTDLLPPRPRPRLGLPLLVFLPKLPSFLPCLIIGDQTDYYYES